PLDVASKAVTAPAVIVIDGLDASVSADFRKDILLVLAGKVSSDTRILVTSRPLKDIHDILHSTPHVRHISIDDLPVTEDDIQLYISKRLSHLPNVFRDVDFQKLTSKSAGLFKWARLACDYVTDTTGVHQDPKSRFEAVTSATGNGTRLLDGMYRSILTEITAPGKVTFSCVMAQIIASLEPLPMTALTSMQEHFPRDDDGYHYTGNDMQQVLSRLGSLVIGATDSQIPIRPLHPSFYDFLKDWSDFSIYLPSAQRNFAFASLHVMKYGLPLNTRDPESAYLLNTVIREKDCIAPELSYACRFWAAHVRATSFETSLAKEVEAFFEGQRPVFWLEALAQNGCLNVSVESLSSIADWYTIVGS
ncbi:hypothetical protein AZE42_08053, partial [Rhizopogon vesiculosus]